MELVDHFAKQLSRKGKLRFENALQKLPVAAKEVVEHERVEEPQFLDVMYDAGFGLAIAKVDLYCVFWVELEF